MTPLLCCRNWDIWRKISPQLGLQRTWRHVWKKSGGNRNWKLWRWHCCGNQQSCRAGWRKLFRSSYLLLIRDRKKTPSWVLVNSVFPILQVYMSTRRGAWIIRQVSDNGVPVDMKYNTRFVHILFQLFPINFFNWFGEKKLNAMYDHTMYALKPKHRYVVSRPHRVWLRPR